VHPLNGHSQLLFGLPGMVVGTRGARGPVRNLYIFFFKINGPYSYDFILGPATIAVALEAACRKPMGIITRVVAMEGNPLEAEAASCLPHPCSAF